jgi:pimeloyl-ACP methyl ester carboxylesterase
LGLPQLLFNPAMPFRSVHVPKPEVDERAEIKTWVVLGQHDEVIPPNLNREFFSHRPHARVLTCAWLGHRIDLDTFREMLCWAGL